MFCWRELLQVKPSREKVETPLPAVKILVLGVFEDSSPTVNLKMGS
jgi:hypothetical protein